MPFIILIVLNLLISGCVATRADEIYKRRLDQQKLDQRAATTPPPVFQRRASLPVVTTNIQKGLKGKIVGALVDYEDCKSRAVVLLKEADGSRANPHNREPTEILALIREVDRLSREVRTEQLMGDIGGNRPAESSRILVALHLALETLSNPLNYELTYQNSQDKPAFLLLMRTKAEELFRIADEEVTAAKAALPIR